MKTSLSQHQIRETKVIMWKHDYEQKMLNIVSDESTYEKLPTSKTNSVESKNNVLVKRLYDKGYIDSITRLHLSTHNSRTPRIYELPKIHKPDTPLRPTVSCIKSPIYNLSKFLIGILKEVNNQGGYRVKDSYDVMIL